MYLKLWLIERPQFGGYDTYSDAVVVAETADDARSIHPNGTGEPLDDNDPYGTWVTFDEVKAKLIGVAEPSLEAGSVVCASFHAG